jgi:hypothetical protein
MVFGFFTFLTWNVCDVPVEYLVLVLVLVQYKYILPSDIRVAPTEYPYVVL